MMGRLSAIKRYEVPRVIVSRSVEALKELGQGLREAVVLWQGKQIEPARAQITKLIIPTQVTGPLHFNIPYDERIRILQSLSDGEVLLMQIHTHPFEAFHSAADDRLAVIKHNGAISLVVPNFGLSWTGNIQETSVNMHLGGSKWCEVPHSDVDDLIQIV